MRLARPSIRLLRRALGALCVASACLSAVYAVGRAQTVGPPSSVAWTVEMVEDTGSAAVRASLALDANDAPRLVWADGRTVRYAVRTGTRWDVQTIASGSLFSPTIALDPNGTAHIAFYDSASGRLQYARPSGSTWVVETIDARGGGPSIAVDAAGDVHASYVDPLYIALDAAVKYARRIEGTWGTEVAQRSPDRGGATSLAIDRAGNPHIAYSLAGGVGYLRKAAGAWTAEFLGGGQSPSLRLDADDVPSVAYYATASPGQLVYARRSEGTWRPEVVDSGDAGRAAALALDGSGAAQITYEYVGSISGNSTLGLRHAQRIGGGWVISTVDGSGRVSSSSLALTADGTPRVAYTVAGAVRYATGAPLRRRAYLPLAPQRATS